MPMIEAVLLDIDGTLIDNNLLHVLAWRRAFERVGLEVAATTILHKIGMGGDQLVPAILGDEQQQHHQQIRQFHTEEYSHKGLIEHSQPLPGALGLLRALRERGTRVALASSAKEEELRHSLGMLGGREAVDEIVTSADVSATKPDADIFSTALEKLGSPKNALTVGDTVYDVMAAGKLRLPCLALLSGGIERKLLEEAGAAAIYLNAADLVAHLDDVLHRWGTLQVMPGV
jgi:HAD superfamily hydrolase (TIGR01509 family)